MLGESSTQPLMESQPHRQGRFYPCNNSIRAERLIRSVFFSFCSNPSNSQLLQKIEKFSLFSGRKISCIGLLIRISNTGSFVVKLFFVEVSTFFRSWNERNVLKISQRCYISMRRFYPILLKLFH